MKNNLYTGVVSIKCDEPHMTHIFHHFNFSALTNSDAEKKAMEIVYKNTPDILKHAFEFYRVPKSVKWENWKEWTDEIHSPGCKYLSRETENYRSHHFSW